MTGNNKGFMKILLNRDWSADLPQRGKHLKGVSTMFNQRFHPESL